MVWFLAQHLHQDDLLGLVCFGWIMLIAVEESKDLRIVEAIVLVMKIAPLQKEF